MSGAEIFGIAAAVLQIADLGARVSVKLFGFARKVRGAAEKIDLISKEIAATGALLQQLSQQLDKDCHAQLLRRELVDSANELVRECKKIFKNIDQAIDGNSGNKIILSLKQKIHCSYLDSEIDALRVNLENLKSSIGIMQNLLIYAEQLRNRERLPVLKEQQDLLNALGNEKLANEQRYQNLMKAITERQDGGTILSLSAGMGLAQLPNTYIPFGTHCQQLGAKDLNTGPHAPLPTSPSILISSRDVEMRDYTSLVANMLEEVDSRQYNLQSSTRARVHDGVLDIHWREWAPLRQSYKDEVLLANFDQLPQLINFWRKKIQEQDAGLLQGEVASIKNTEAAVLPSNRHLNTCKSPIPISQTVEKEPVVPHQLKMDESHGRVLMPPVFRFPKEDNAMSLKQRAESQARRPKLEFKQQMTEESRKIKDDQEFKTSTERQETKLNVSDRETEETHTSVLHHQSRDSRPLNPTARPFTSMMELETLVHDSTSCPKHPYDLTTTYLPQCQGHVAFSGSSQNLRSEIPKPQYSLCYGEQNHQEIITYSANSAREDRTNPKGRSRTGSRGRQVSYQAPKYSQAKESSPLILPTGMPTSTEISLPYHEQQIARCIDQFEERAPSLQGRMLIAEKEQVESPEAGLFKPSPVMNFSGEVIEPESLDIQALLTEWTTLTPEEMARGDVRLHRQVRWQQDH